MAKTRLKAQTLAAPQSREETQNWIKDLGDVQREHTRAVAAMNDEIATITERHKTAINTLADRAKELQSGIQSWCEANRAELTAKGKTANLITGEVSWRLRPPSIRIRSQEAVLEALRTLGLIRFVRVCQWVGCGLGTCRGLERHHSDGPDREAVAGSSVAVERGRHPGRLLDRPQGR